MISLHGDSLNGGGRVVCRAEEAFDSLVLAEHRSRRLQLREHRRETKRGNNLRVKFSGFGADHTGRGCVGVLLGLDAAELPEEILRDHEKIRHAVQPPGQLVGIELIDAVERLELAAGSGIQLRKW